VIRIVFTKCRELFGEFDRCRWRRGDQNRICRELHNFTSLSRRPTETRIVGIAARSRRVDGLPVASASGAPVASPQLGRDGDVGASERTGRRSLSDQTIAAVGGHADVGDQLAAKNGVEVAEHLAPGSGPSRGTCQRGVLAGSAGVIGQRGLSAFERCSTPEMRAVSASPRPRPNETVLLQPENVVSTPSAIAQFPPSLPRRAGTA